MATEEWGGPCVNAGDIFTSAVSGLHYLNYISCLTCLNSKPLVYHFGPRLDHGFITQKNYQCQRILSFCETGQAGVRQGKTILLEMTSIWSANSLQTLLIIFSIYKTRFMIQPTITEEENTVTTHSLGPLAYLTSSAQFTQPASDTIITMQL